MGKGNTTGRALGVIAMDFLPGSSSTGELPGLQITLPSPEIAR